VPVVSRTPDSSGDEARAERGEQPGDGDGDQEPEHARERRGDEPGDVERERREAPARGGEGRTMNQRDEKQVQ